MSNEKQELKQTTDRESTERESLPQAKKQKPKEIISLDIDEEGEEPLELTAETTLDLIQDAQEERYQERIARHTQDETIQESLAERQDLKPGQGKLPKQKAQHHTKSPDLAGGDVDAAWDEANVGEETVGGMAPTPDQDVVEEIGEAVGIVYEDDEPLQTGEKLEERDRQRWELDPDSAEDAP